MQVLEDRVPFRTGQLVDIGDGGLGVAGAVTGPARQQRRDQIGDRPADGLVDVELRGRIFLLFQVAHADHQPGHAIGFVDGQDAVGELDGLVDIAIGERGDERAIEQFIVLRIGAKRRAIECRRRVGVPLHAGMTGGQIAAGHRQRFQIALARKLRRVVGRMIGRLGRNRAGTAKAVKASAAIVQRLKRMENITVRLSSRNFTGSVSNANPTGGIKPSDNAAFGAQPQGYRVAN